MRCLTHHSVSITPKPRPLVQHLNWLRGPLVILAMCSLAGCDTLNNYLASDRIDYTKVGAAPPLSVPPNLSQPELSSSFVAPPRNTDLLAKPPVLPPLHSGPQTPPYNATAIAAPTATLTPANEPIDISVAQDAQHSWLVLKGNISLQKLWAQLETFWQNNGFTLATDSPTTGMLQTDWAENHAGIASAWGRSPLLDKLVAPLYSSGTRDRFRTVVERNANGTINISITHNRMEEILIGQDKESSRWVAQPRDRTLETAFLQRLMQSLGLTAAQAQQRIARAAQTADRASFSSSGDALTLNVPSFESAWRHVGIALDRTDYKVIGSDKSNAIYTVSRRDATQDSKQGLLRRLFSRSGDTPRKPVIPAKSYQVRVMSSRDMLMMTEPIAIPQTPPLVTVVKVIDQNGQPDTSPAAKKIMTQLYQALN